MNQNFLMNRLNQNFLKNRHYPLYLPYPLYQTNP
jgi:hypothetical protein